MPLADAIDTVQRFVDVLFLVYIACVFLYIISSWIRLPYNLWLNRLQQFLYDVVNPYLRIFRRILPSVSLGGMGLDLSPIIGIFVLYGLRALAIRGLEALQ